MVYINEGEPQQGLLVFASKDRGVLVRHRPVSVKGAACSRLFIGLTEPVKWRNNITDESIYQQYKDLNEPILMDATGKHPCYVKDYPREFVDFENYNPEDPVVFVLCNFDGTIPSGISPNTLKIKSMSESNVQLIQENNMLREKYMEAMDYVEVIKQKLEGAKINESG